jgi:hypothetical protein
VTPAHAAARATAGRAAGWEAAVDWQRLGERAPASLRGARIQAHWAAQVISAAGETFLPHVPDTSHTAMRFEAGALVGAELPGATRSRIGVRIADLTLLCQLEGSAVAAELALAGRTLAEAYRWTAREVRARTGAAQLRALVHPGYALPAHPIAGGGRFELDPGLPELARWYANADGALRRLARETPGAGPVRCWPHHFDIATLIAVEADTRGGAVRTVGVGLSPGDELIDEPYWYVNHFPASDGSALPPLACGEWFTGGWIGAVLRGSALVAAGDAAAQAARLDAFLGAGVPASRALALATRLD